MSSSRGGMLYPQRQKLMQAIACMMHPQTSAAAAHDVNRTPPNDFDYLIGSAVCVWVGGGVKVCVETQGPRTPPVA